MHIQKYLKSIYLFAFLFFISFWAQAQKLDYVQGQFIIQIEAHLSIDRVIADFKDTYGYSIEVERKVSPILNIYTVNYDYTTYRDAQVWRDLLMLDKVEVAQHNHFVNLRQNVPNDPEFPNQWQYVNNGQDGGLVGADIDMPEAWDFATGGITAHGDTIVACIIDDGIDNDHPDIAPNLFINHAEIPGNGIDDDNNGFIDDYRGWRTSSDNDDVYTGGGHGTPVTGIVGAKGNDAFGVAGVNWDVKLMIVRGGTGVESEVIEAYSYPLSFRRKYNETNGEEGAFVVTTNASWGVDFGQPDNAPLWCAFYDTLGQEGIISCGATINGNQDVDVIGDLPTACSSDYLISVTNMNRNDVKVTGAGYGAETIDLGAFGAQTWTTSAGGGFNGFGGTSGATPHVTGTVALAYSMNCPNFMDLVKTDPGAAALQIKQVILDGTDPNESLEGITTTGGRLNVFNTLTLLQSQGCADCAAPFNVDVTVSTDTIIFSWPTVDSTLTNFRYRVEGETDWIEVMDLDSSFILSGVPLCTPYEYQLQNICDTLVGDWGLINVVTSTGCCENPEAFVVSSIEENEVTCTWAEAPFALSYNFRYREEGTMDWIELNVEGTSFTVGDLMNCTGYEFQIQTVCETESRPYSESITAFIGNCDNPCIDLPYCDISGYNVTEEYISYVQINTLESITEDEGYGDFTAGPTTDLMIGGSYVMTLDMVYVGQTYPESFAVWVDLNQNGTLEDEEKLLESDGNTELYADVVEIPATALLGNTRMRVAMRYQEQPPACTDENFGAFGETEDYCINMVEFMCSPITFKDTTFTSTTEIGLEYDLNLNVDGRFLSYRKVGETDWDEVEMIDIFYTVENLEACTEYEFRTRTQCGNDFTEYTESVIYSTKCVSSSIDLQNEIKVYPNPFRERITINLNDVSVTNGSYEVYNQLGSIVLQKENIRSQKFDILTEGLTPGVYYLKIMDESKTISYRKIVKM